MTAILELEVFMRDAKSGQPLHRAILGQDDVRAAVRDVDRQKLVLSIELTKARTYEVAQKLSGPAPVMAPTLGPGSTQAMPTLNLQNLSPPPPKNMGGDGN